MKLANLRKVLDTYGKLVQRSAKANLTKAKKRNTDSLYNSIKYLVRKYKGDLNLTFSMLGYGTFVDKGVKGTKSSTKAPQSPYRFGSGKGGSGLRAGINKWVTQKKDLKGVVRDKKGRFIPRKSLQFLIVRSIWNTGLETTNFFSNPFNNLQKRNKSEIIDAFLKDFTADLEKEVNSKTFTDGK